jgi:hypothetical protein
MTAPIALLSDFGLTDPYVGQMKAALVSRAPEAPLIDISHGVEPFRIAQGAFFLAASRDHFPPGTVFLAVVDPGVGSARRAVALAAHDRFFVLPDNGLTALALTDPARSVAVDIGRTEVSSTFHGRDLFAPAAARLALGEPLGTLGSAIDPASLVRPAWSEPVVEEGRIRAAVVHVDHFGNAVLNLPESWRPRLAERMDLRLAGPAGGSVAVVDHYGELSGNAVGILAGSQGYLELSRNMSSVASSLGLSPGDEIVLVFAS